MKLMLRLRPWGKSPCLIPCPMTSTDPRNMAVGTPKLVVNPTGYNAFGRHSIYVSNETRSNIKKYVYSRK